MKFPYASLFCLLLAACSSHLPPGSLRWEGTFGKNLWNLEHKPAEARNGWQWSASWRHQGSCEAPADEEASAGYAPADTPAPKKTLLDVLSAPPPLSGNQVLFLVLMLVAFMTLIVVRKRGGMTVTQTQTVNGEIRRCAPPPRPGARKRRQARTRA